MNKHIFFDILTANIGALVSGSKKFFAGSTDSLSFEELIRSTELSVAEINPEGTYEIRVTSSAPVITCGVSLGGWAANLHRCYYNSSTAYVPLLSEQLKTQARKP